MYGKHFASAYTGSMMGAGAEVFAVWGYVIASTAQGQVELNPVHVGLLLGMTPEAVNRAVAYLERPDPRSRSKLDRGCRLVREGEFAYRVPTWASYRAVRNEDDRRAYNRQKQQEHRAKTKPVKARVNDSQQSQTSQQMSSMSAHTETESEVESEAETETGKTNGKGHALAVVVQGQTLEVAGTAVVRRFEEVRAFLQAVDAEALAGFTARQRRQFEARGVFAFWASKLGHKQAILDDNRERAITKALKTSGGNVSELLFAVKGASMDDWAKAELGRHDVTVLFSDRAHIEKYANKCEGYRKGEPHPYAAKLAAVTTEATA